MSAAVLAAALAAAAWAGGSPTGAGRGLEGPADPSFDPVLRRLESRMPVYEELDASSVQVPARTIELGLDAKMYRCWKLKLTGDHGRRALAVFERLRSVQDALRDQRAKLAQDLVAYASSPKPDAALQGRILEAEKALEGLIESFGKTLEAAARNGLLKSPEKALSGGRRTITPRMTKDDYTMVRDEESPECRKG